MPVVLPLERSHVECVLKSRAFSSIGEPKRNRALFVMQLCLGPRIHELLFLLCGDVLYRDGSLRQSIYFRKTKTAEPREIEACNPLIGRYLRPWILRLSQLGQLHADLPLFPGRVPGRSLTRQQVYYLYTAAFRELGLRRFGTHSPRKTWATQTYCYWLDQQRKGRNVDPLLKVKELGGWKSLESCAHYLGFGRIDGAESQVNLYRGWQL